MQNSRVHAFYGGILYSGFSPLSLPHQYCPRYMLGFLTSLGFLLSFIYVTSIIKLNIIIRPWMIETVRNNTYRNMLIFFIVADISLSILTTNISVNSAMARDTQVVPFLRSPRTECSRPTNSTTRIICNTGGYCEGGGWQKPAISIYHNCLRE